MNKKIKTFILATIALPYSYASANESIVNLGVGASVAPVYEGSKKYQIGLVLKQHMRILVMIMVCLVLV